VFRSIAAIVLAIRFAHPEVSEVDATRYAASLQVEAQEHDFDPLTGVAIIHHESRFHPRAVSPDGEDYGLAQVRARHVGACRKDKNPKGNPSAACRAVKERLLQPEESIRVMAELITSHRKLCRKKAGSTSMLSWLASYQGRNSIKEDRWCTPGDGTHEVIRYRDRLVREVARHSKEIEAADQAATATAAAKTDGRGQVADSREPAPVEIVPPGRGG
jgi:Transglycosylase SLT domain